MEFRIEGLPLAIPRLFELPTLAEVSIRRGVDPSRFGLCTEREWKKLESILRHKIMEGNNAPAS